MQCTVTRQEVIVGIFRIDPNFDSVTLLDNLFLLLWQWETAGDQELPLHQIFPRDHLTNGMFHLQSCVHLHEIVLVVVEVEYEFNRPSIIIANSTGSVYSRLMNFIPNRLTNA
jgi:hypothetical protein